MTSDETPSSSGSPADSLERAELSTPELDAELDSLRREADREVRRTAALGLLGPVLLTAILALIGVTTYIYIVKLREHARAEMKKDPVQAMDSLLRAAEQASDENKSGGR